MNPNPPKALYRRPVQLNAQLHRHKRLKPGQDHSILDGSHAAYLNAAEFAQAALSFPIVFVPASAANPSISPVAMLGLVPNSNLFVNDGRWDARYMPAFFRRLPYLTAPLQDSDRTGVYIDEAWEGLSDTEGEPLFDDSGNHAPALTQAIEFLQAFDEESKRTGLLCERLQALGLFTNMTADATLPDGTTLSVDGFMTIDEAKLRNLPNATVVALHRDGVLPLLHWHLLSLNHVGELVNRQARRSTPSA